MTDDHKSNVERLADEWADPMGDDLPCTLAAVDLRGAIEQDKAAGWLSPDEAKALREELAQAKRDRTELDGAICWGTNCLNCASILDRSYADHARAEKAEEAARNAREDTLAEVEQAIEQKLGITSRALAVVRGLREQNGGEA